MFTYGGRSMGQALSRSEAREVAYRLVFASDGSDDALSLALGDKFAPEPELKYLQGVVTTVQTNLATIDQKIAAHLQGWTLDRLRRTDLAALRLALGEIEQGTVPLPVIINEAVNLAKKYGDQNSGAFVNGILAKITE